MSTFARPGLGVSTGSGATALGTSLLNPSTHSGSHDKTVEGTKDSDSIALAFSPSGSAVRASVPVKVVDRVPDCYHVGTHYPTSGMATGLLSVTPLIAAPIVEVSEKSGSGSGVPSVPRGVTSVVGAPVLRPPSKAEDCHLSEWEVTEILCRGFSLVVACGWSAGFAGMACLSWSCWRSSGVGVAVVAA